MVWDFEKKKWNTAETKRPAWYAKSLSLPTIHPKVKPQITQMELTNNYDGIKSFKRDLESPWPAENQEVKRSKKEDTQDEENKIPKQDDSADKDDDQKGEYYLNCLIK
jgi:hypothetical protein